jgi:subtilase family serine protease
LSQLRGGWSGNATYTNNLPAGQRDVSAFKVFQFRASVNFEDGRNLIASPQDFRVRLTDGTGASVTTTVSNHSEALFYPPGSVGPVPKVVLNTIRIPLTAFSALNLSDIRAVTFIFNRTPSGALLITDLAFADAVPPPALPDLTETAVSNPPARVLQGGSFAVTDTAANEGLAGAPTSTTRHYLSGNTTRSADDEPLAPARTVPALGAGATSTGTVTVTVPSGTPTTSYFLLACADDSAGVPESDEGNNCVASATKVTVESPAGTPDLVETALTVPSSVIVGVSFSVTDTAANQGSAGAAATTTRFYQSPDAIRNKGDKLLAGTRAVPELSAGESSTGPTTLIIKAGTPAGAYFLLACADDRKVVAEGPAESNNCRAAPVNVRGPDLIESSVSNPPSSRVAGSTFSVTDTVQNAGDAAAGDSTTRYYLSPDQFRNSGDKRLNGVRSVGTLAPGGSANGTTVVTIPLTTVPGLYYVLACADDKKAVGETNEKNNCRASATRIDVQ